MKKFAIILSVKILLTTVLLIPAYYFVSMDNNVMTDDMFLGLAMLLSMVTGILMLFIWSPVEIRYGEMKNTIASRY